MSTTNPQSVIAPSAPTAAEGDRKLAEQHLRAVYGRARDGDGQIVIYSKRPFAAAFFEPAAIDVAAAYACERSCTCDVYHLVNMVSPQAVTGIRRRMGRGRESELPSRPLESDTGAACDRL